MKSTVAINTFHTIESDFHSALDEWKNNPLFQKKDFLYTDEEKYILSERWKPLFFVFIHLRRVIRTRDFLSFVSGKKWETFLIRYYAVHMYYEFLYDLQQTFGRHEEFIRQHLDDAFLHNYSTIARYVYHPGFLYYLHYPKEFIVLFQDYIDPVLYPLVDHPREVANYNHKHFSLDMINVWYYIWYRMTLLLTWIAKNGGRFIAHIHLSRPKHGNISPENIDAYSQRARPGDILLVRRNWEGTNVSIPGFWKHMAMYVGTGNFLYETYGISDLEGHLEYAIEAIGSGVRIIPLEQFMSHYDYFSAFRTPFSQEKIHRVLRKTLKLLGVGYDYSFNFFSDRAFVCSTLITKAYLPEYSGDEGLHIRLVRVGTGGITFPPNDLVEKYDHECQNPSNELESVIFIDSSQQDKSFIASEYNLRKSWKRSRFSFFLD